MLCGLATINHEKKNGSSNKARNCFEFMKNLGKEKKRVKVGIIE